MSISHFKGIKLFFICLFLSALSLQGAEVKQPNILFLFSDDQSWEMLGLHGGQVQTPNLDRLAERGTLFTHAYNMGAWHGAVCVASRTMLNTGYSLWRAREVEERMVAGERIPLWGDWMRDAGYETFFTGKWHVQAPIDPSFDHVGSRHPGMPYDKDFRDISYQRGERDEENGWTPWDPKFGGYWSGPNGQHLSEVLGDDGVRFLRQASGNEQPFFIYLAFNAPHDPRQAPKEYVDLYPLEEIDIPENYLPEYPYREEIGAGERLRDERLAPWPRTKEAVQLHRQEYLAIITHMDAQIGRILDELEDSGELENTLIVYTSDHGLGCGRHGLLGKQNMYEHSLRVPLILSGPGVPENFRIDTPIYLQDVLPTTLEVANASVPEHIEFKSLLPLLDNPQHPHYGPVYTAMYPEMQRAVIQQGWKLIHYPQAEVYRLYDTNSDPFENDDLAGNPEYASKIAELKKALVSLQGDFGDPLLD